MEGKKVLWKTTSQGDFAVSGRAALPALHGKELPETHTGGWGFVVNSINDVKLKRFPS